MPCVPVFVHMFQKRKGGTCVLSRSSLVTLQHAIDDSDQTWKKYPNSLIYLEYFYFLRYCLLQYNWCFGSAKAHNSLSTVFAKYCCSDTNWSNQNIKMNQYHARIFKIYSGRTGQGMDGQCPSFSPIRTLRDMNPSI